MITISTARRTRRVRTLALGIAAVLTMSACQPNRFVSGWIPYWGGATSRQAVSDVSATGLFSEASLFWYGARADGTVTLNGTQGNLNTTVTALRAKGLPVIPTVVDGTAVGTMSNILANTGLRTNHVTKLVALTVNNNFDGVDIDYEVFAFSQRSSWTSIKPTWIAFVNELAAGLHAKGKLLSVTVPAVWNSGASGYWVYAQPDIAAAVDRLRLMVYDWSVSFPGPIAPMWWVDSVIAYSSSVVPVAKLQLGVPAYGRHWAVKKYSTDVCAASMVFNDAITLQEVGPLATSHGIIPTRDSFGELTFSWTESSAGEQVVKATPPGYVASGTTPTDVNSPTGDVLGRALRVNPKIPATCTVQHTVHVPDATSILQRAQAALGKGWSGIAVWAFGYETSDVYNALGTIAQQRPNGTPVTVANTPSVVGGTATITGYAYNPEFDLPVPVQMRLLQAQADIDVVPPQVILARLNSAGMPAGLGPFHAYSVSFPSLGPGSYRFCATQVAWGGTGSTIACQSFTV